MKKWLIAVLLVLVQGVSQAGGWTDMAEEIVVRIDEAESLYLAGDSRGAGRAVVQAYFGVFEDKKMEAAIRTTLGSKHAWKVERLFGKMRKLIKKGATAEELNGAAVKVREAVRRDSLVLDEKEIPLAVFDPTK